MMKVDISPNLKHRRVFEHKDDLLKKLKILIDEYGTVLNEMQIEGSLRDIQIYNENDKDDS